MENRTHWEGIYTTKDSTQVSWYQRQPVLSLELIRRAGVDKTARIIDGGGGASTLIDSLLADGFQHVTVLDISEAALRVARQRLDARAAEVTWHVDDITRAELPAQQYDLWHDRAVFHFLTQPDDRRRYMDIARQAIKSGGQMIMATFALDGPTRCSGLEIVRYSADSLREELGQDFTLLSCTTETHRTPFETDQQFIYCHLRKR
jgi:2-polyprenyl-3-methyl-5-hydroxy-6-metoxy-1,4-benzoquinol methylase